MRLVARDGSNFELPDEKDNEDHFGRNAQPRYRMVKRRNSPYASHNPTAPTRVPMDPTPQSLPAMPAPAAKPKISSKKQWSTNIQEEASTSKLIVF